MRLVLSADQLVPASLCPDKAEGCELNGAGASRPAGTGRQQSLETLRRTPRQHPTCASPLLPLSIFLPSVFICICLLVVYSYSLL